jgi:ubiquinone/menaquinone biosynthesis C-methylase UbiE
LREEEIAVRGSSHDFVRFVRKLHQQAVESREERWPLYMAADLRSCRRVLDVGCGSGAVTMDVSDACGGTVVGVDASRGMLRQAERYLRGPPSPHKEDVRLVRADGHRLPFPDGVFDAAVCNLVLMWVEDPQRVVNEMARVVRPGGRVLASLEPDFGGKVDHPEDPMVDPVFRGSSIRRRGGDPHIGRKLRALFVRAGLETTVGLGNRRIWSIEEEKRSFLQAREHYRAILARNDIPEHAIDEWERRELQALDEGVAFNFFPQFYALGRKPSGSS